MSHYNDFETTITDEKALVRALCRCNTRDSIKVTVDLLEVHKDPQNLYGYHNDVRDQKAHVIMRRQIVGSAANDIGFVKNADGKYNAIISDFDRTFYNQDWLNKLYTYYNVEKSKIELETRGIKYHESLDSKGRIQLCAKFETKTSGNRVKVRV